MPAAIDHHLALERRAVVEGAGRSPRRRRAPPSSPSRDGRAGPSARAAAAARGRPRASSCASIRCGIRWTTWTSRPAFSRPRAASRPSRPPPMTAARAHAAARREHAIAVVERAEDEDAALEGSVALARACRDGPRSRPRSAASSGRLPVAMTSASYGSTVPSAPMTCFRARSIALDAHAGVQRHAVGGVPRQRVDEDVLRIVASRPARSTAGCGCSCRTARRRTR